MKQIGLIIFTLLLNYLFSNNWTQNNNDQTVNIDSSLSDIFIKAVQYFPNDSASLYRFYFIWNSTKDKDKIDKQIERLKRLTSKESVARYIIVENNLKPLMIKIVKSNTINRSQSDSLVFLYSDYDYFSGESLLSKLLTNNDNYDLVWQSFQIMANESKKDTCFISGLIKLKNNISTNAELAESMGDFVVKAIQSNPIGFLEMYGKRRSEKRSDFANYITIWDEPDKELIEKFSAISKNSTNKNYSKLATELIERIRNY